MSADIIAVLLDDSWTYKLSYDPSAVDLGGAVGTAACHLADTANQTLNLQPPLDALEMRVTYLRTCESHSHSNLFVYSCTLMHPS